MGDPAADLKKLAFVTKKALRKAFRMADNDLPYHACRINLLGSNSPWKSYGKSDHLLTDL
jgi:hypothetical protein